MAKPVAYSYVRFSTPEQERGDSYRRQTDKAADYCAKRGLHLDAETFFDRGVSAYRSANERNGALGVFIAMAEAGDIPPGSYLLVENLDRLSRDQIDSAAGLFLRLLATGVRLVTLFDGREYSSESLRGNPTDLVVSLLVFMRANEESRTKATRVSDAWTNKRALAVATRKPLTKHCPGWLTLKTDRSGYELIPDRARIVRRIVAEVLAGKGQQQVASTLNSEGVPCFGHGHRKAGVHWHRSYIKKLTESPALIGTYVPHRWADTSNRKKVREPLAPIPDYFPPVIKPDQWEALQALRNAVPQVHAKRPITHLLAGLARCSLCGSSMTRVWKGKRGGVPKLVCTKAKAKAGCKYRAVHIPAIEAAMVAQAEAFVGTAPSARSAELSAALENAEAAMDAMHTLMSDAAHAFALHRTPAMRELLAGREADYGEAKVAYLKALEANSEASLKMTFARLAAVRDTLQADPLDVNRANAALRSAVVQAVVDPDYGEVRFEWKHARWADGFPLGEPMVFDPTALFKANPLPAERGL